MTIFEECLGESTDCAIVPIFKKNRMLIKSWNHTMQIYVNTSSHKKTIPISLSLEAA